jgi:putative cardiolipin synthase
MRKLHEKGVRMSVLTNSLAATDTPIVHIGYAAYRIEMLRLGVNLYELSPTRGTKAGMLGLFGSSRAKLHAKTVVVDRQQLFVGSINLDARSARENTEQGLIISSPELAGEVLQLLGSDHGESSFHLRLTADRNNIEWIGRERGVETVFDDEPDAGFLLKFVLKVLGPFAPEELL